jgi:plasmid stabilization system protein ParE
MRTRRELRWEVERYDEQRSGFGAGLVKEIDDVLRRIAAFPEIGPPFVEATRRVLFRTFPFALIYTIRPTELIVLALAHQRRQPLYWLDRV